MELVPDYRNMFHTSSPSPATNLNPGVFQEFQNYGESFLHTASTTLRQNTARFYLFCTFLPILYYSEEDISRNCNYCWTNFWTLFTRVVPGFQQNCSYCSSLHERGGRLLGLGLYCRGARNVDMNCKGVARPMMVNINIEVKEENMINFWNSGGDATELLQQADGWSPSGSGQI